ncbi:MAG TPA: 16S rRNA (guanine(966)-N(2))-methyltransferase RsmD [Chthoniobacterales bacterium]|nr:16S rRNA (guanine(966)-N(2))-methyltransferase RsmD [Chthoniobacterales bacterium]
MRVIAGAAGGIRLDVPKAEVRPTMDRVKAAIFSSLGHEIIGARVLDLFAGTGALGIEALSRGAASALFVDENSAAIAAIERNLARTKLEGRVRKQDVFAFLRSEQTREPFKIIFADPPYEKTKSGSEFTRLLLQNKRLAEGLAPTGIFVLEKRPAERMPPMPLWKVIRARSYGATEVLFLQRAPVIPSEVEESRDGIDSIATGCLDSARHDKS